LDNHVPGDRQRLRSRKAQSPPLRSASYR
jgi:hypothetical protein